MEEKISIFWFRRDLRIEDNTALYQALKGGLPVLPIFIFDENILNELEEDDSRVSFIYNELQKINSWLETKNGKILCLKGSPLNVWQELISKYSIINVFFNKDYEPYAIKRDTEVIELLNKNNISVSSFKDHVIFEENEILKNDGTPYTVYTPYKNKWLEKFKEHPLGIKSLPNTKFYRIETLFPKLQDLGFHPSEIKVKAYTLSDLATYGKTRDFPHKNTTSYLGPHLRFGTVSIRQIIKETEKSDPVFLSELIWREFFIQILFHFPRVVTQNFKQKYNGISWRNTENDFELWCQGKTGYPMVDAGMRQLNQTGYMHNRVRMVTASFLCKHLLIDWRLGEAYFAKKLLDYELASNNGNWQWAAGTGCDAAPYFRVFNPTTQLQNFDPNMHYCKTWLPELLNGTYTAPIVLHDFARKRALEAYKIGLTM